jgi:UDP-N-acetylmuramoyl-tripeptide--D-alanyl-D-alanine ligase
VKLQLSDIVTAVQGELIGADVAVNGVGIDTRTLQASDLYIAIKGKQFDGHDFVDKAQQAGAIAILVEQHININLPQIVVKDSRLALAELAGFWRKQLPVKVVGVTGSNGKTTVKEMIAAILATQGETLFTQGNLNNDIGVPLTLLKLNANHRYAVIEMGANHPGEIAYTSQYAQPQVSVITNVGAAHIEGFGDIHGVAKTKGEIIETLATDGVAVINRDDEFYDFWCDLAKSRKKVAFGFSEQADLRAENISTELRSNGYVTEFDLKTVGCEGLTIKLNLAGEHNVKNALAAIAAALQFHIDLQDIKRGLETVKPVTGRMQPLRGRKGNLIIDDTYNANPSSLNAALTVLDANQTNWLILGAFGELGADSVEIHRQMGDSIKAMPVQRLFATGELARHSVDAFGFGGQYFETQQQLIAALDEAVTGQETLLVKGSRSQKMENVVAAMVDNFRAA